jgi:serine/threonine protein kinase
LSSDSQAYLAGFQAGSVLAGYRLETQVGAGGMAVVFRARDERLNRLVALKILSPALASDAEFRSRFIAESRAAAAVDDPHIIPVYEAGEADGVLFIAMRFVQGGDLYRVLASEGALPPERAAGFISPVASALDAAHRAGLVHRDVKPGNILVDAREDRPDHVYLSDFGVSKAMASAGMTIPGHFVGTADYSAPEQIQGRAVDGRTDQYALACVAFQLLTGALPFGADQDTPVLLEHLSAPPPSLASRRPGLPGAVDQVLAKAMAKVPEKRYASCLEFADALRTALGLAPYVPQGSPTGPGIPQPATSPPEVLTLGGTGAADQRGRPAGPTAPTEPVTGSGGDGTPPTRPLRRGVADRLAAATAWIGRHRLPALAVACAILAAVVVPVALGSPASSPKPVKSSPPPNSASPVSSPTYTRTAIQLPSPYAGEGVDSLSFSPSGTTLAIVAFDVCLWDIANQSCTTGYATNPVFKADNLVAFSPDGRTLAVGGISSVRLWNVAAKTVTATFTDPGSKGLDSMAFSPDGKTLAVGDFNGNSYLWDVATGKLTATLTDPGSKGVRPVAFSPDGKTLAAGDFNGHSYLWDVATGKLTATFADSSSKGVNTIAFSPNGQTLAAGDQNGFIYLWDIATGKLTVTLGDPDSRGVNTIAFSPNGQTLAAGDQNGDGYVWNISTGTLAATLIDPDSLAINAIAFSPNGNTIATGDESGGLGLWHISS